MNQDLINSATKDLINYFQKYLEGKNRVIEYREFKEHTFRAPIEIEENTHQSILSILSSEEIETIKEIDLFGIIHIDGTNEINLNTIRKHIELRRISNIIFSDLLKSYNESQKHNLWFLNSIAKVRETYIKLLNNDITSIDTIHFKSHLEELLKSKGEAITEEYKVILGFIVKELDVYSKYLLYGINIVEIFVSIEQSLSLIEKLVKLNLVERYRDSWILSRALAENPKLLEEFSDEIFLTSRLPLTNEDASKILNTFGVIGIESKQEGILSERLKNNIQLDHNKILIQFNNDKKLVQELLSLFNTLNSSNLQALGNLFELLRLVKNQQSVILYIQGSLQSFAKKEIEEQLEMRHLSSVFNSEINIGKDKYLYILQEILKIKKNDGKLNGVIDEILLLVNTLVNNSVDIFDSVHTNKKIDSVFSFLYQFENFNLYNLVFYSDITDTFSNGIETLNIRFENYFHNTIKILNIAINEPEVYRKITQDHNNRLIKFVNKTQPLVKNEVDRLGIITQILAWGEKNELIQITDTLIDKVENIKENKNEVLSVLKDIHVKLLSAYSQLLFDFLNRDLKNANTDEIEKQYNQTIVERFQDYSKNLAYFYVLGFYFEVGNNLNLKHVFSSKAFDQYLRGY